MLFGGEFTLLSEEVFKLVILRGGVRILILLNVVTTIYMLQDLKDENIRLIEIQRNTFKAKFDGRCKTVSYSDKQDTFVTEYDTPSLKPECIGNEEIIKEVLVHREAWEDENDRKLYPRGLLKIGSDDCQLMYPCSTGQVVDDALTQHRKLAFSQSIFSAVLSLLVGVIMWKAKDPCMPLVMALFIVVGISFKSVVQFFSSVKNRLASDAVALLGFNSFILGLLMYPTLPLVANVLVPLVLNLADKMLSWLG
ncbi:Coiled-coil protein [Thalictrum thalictroides]|uniref:Coiled-coil protein n=1 Tax=Thalictrum thalictroides TaxID=46969 RepID=A0A7J6UZN4_THATH|nr:Coiled-coil protein [Thalictrum thalictroides]